MNEKLALDSQTNTVSLLPSTLWQCCRQDLPTASLTQQPTQIPAVFLMADSGFLPPQLCLVYTYPLRDLFSALTISQGPCKGLPCHCLSVQSFLLLSPSLLLEL